MIIISPEYAKHDGYVAPNSGNTSAPMISGRRSMIALINHSRATTTYGKHILSLEFVMDNSSLSIPCGRVRQTCLMNRNVLCCEDMGHTLVKSSINLRAKYCLSLENYMSISLKELALEYYLIRFNLCEILCLCDFNIRRILLIQLFDKLE